MAPPAMPYCLAFSMSISIILWLATMPMPLLASITTVVGVSFTMSILVTGSSVPFWMRSR